MFLKRIRSVLVCLWLLIFSVGMYLEWQPNYKKRFDDFSSIAVALERYRDDHGVYPVSNGSHSTNQTWIPELVPSYLNKVPQDPRYLYKVQNKQYLYISNGADYKLIAHAPEDFGYISKTYPELVDPRRSTYSYGIWTEGASTW